MKTSNNGKIKDFLSFKFSKNVKLLIIIGSISFFSALLFSVLTFVYARLHLNLAIFFFSCAILFIILSAAFVGCLIFAGKRINQEIDEAAVSFREQFDALNDGRIRLRNKEFNNEALSDLQRFVNSMIAKSNELRRKEIEKKFTEEKFCDYEDFPKELHDCISSSSSFMSALVAIQAEGGDSAPDDVDEALLRQIRLIFSPILICKKANGSYLAYVENIGTEKVFSILCEQFVRSFNVTQIVKGSGVVLFYSATLSASIFPGVSEAKLLALTEKGLKKAEPIIINKGDTSLPIPSASMSDNPKRAVLLNANETFFKRFFSSEDERSKLDVLAQAISYYCSAMEFSTGGVLLYNSCSDFYALLVEKFTNPNDNRGMSLFNESQKIRGDFINPIFDFVGENGFFFVNDSSLLPYQISERMQSIGAKTVVFYPMVFSGKKKALAYLVSSSKKSGQDIMERECVDSFFCLVTSMVVSIDKERETARKETILNSLMDRDNNILYAIDSDSYRLLDFSNTALKCFPDAKRGDLCYKSLMDLDAPCIDCPLRKGTLKRSISAIGPNEQTMVLLFSKKAKTGNSATILIESEQRFASYSSNLMDKTLNVLNVKALSNEINREIRSRGHGIVLSFRIENLAELKTRYKDETDSILQNVVMMIQEEGYGNLLYRYNSNSFSFLLKSVNKTGLIAFAEEIASLFSSPIQINGDSTYLRVCYSSIAYPNEASTNFEMISLIESELERSCKFGPGYLCEVGRNHLRKADHKEYILQLLEDNLSHNQVETRLSSIVDTVTRKTIGIEFTLGLRGISNETISKKEFLPVAIKNNILTDLDLKALWKVCEFFKNYMDSTLKVNGIKHLCLTMSVTSVLNPVFLEALQKISDSEMMPKGFLVIAVNSKEIIGYEEELKSVIEAAKSLDFRFSAHSFDPNIDSSEKLKGLGFTYVRIARRVLESAMASQSANASFIRMASDFDEKGLVSIVNHVTNKEQAQFCLDLAMPYYIDGAKGSLLTEEEFITYLNFKK